VLPLAPAGLKVVGLEAGGWFQPKDHLPDEIRNNVRNWPHAVQKANQEVPTARNGPNGPVLPRPAYHPMDERHYKAGQPTDDFTDNGYVPCRFYVCEVRRIMGDYRNRHR
jgi:hypothetical protein